MAIYLKNTTYVDWETLEFKKASILAEDGENGGIRFTDTAPDNTPVLDCKGKLVTKAFGCGHHHVYSALARGMGAPAKIPVNFHEILQYIWWTLDKCLDLDMIKASALSTALYCAKNGITFVIDHHASPLAVKGSLETIAQAFDKVGVSHLLCYEMSDRDGDISRQQGLEETEDYLKNHKQGLVGLHASFTVGDDLLKQAVRLAETHDSGIHVHTAEDKYDQEMCLEKHNTRVMKRFANAGVLDFSKTILGHCLHLDADERELLRQSQAYVVQNTESNLNNNVGLFNPEGLGERIMLGTDGMHSDMLRSAKAAYLVGQGSEGISPEAVYKRFRKVHSYLRQNRFSGDGANNLVVLNYDSPTEITPDNFYGHFAYGIDAAHVESVISCGSLIVKDKKILTVDEDEILTFCREMGTKLWKAMQKG
ncbi:MAG: amidohydrolase family protein [bacterium]|nr:amidohydrolase family protein [bacterium]